MPHQLFAAGLKARNIYHEVKMYFYKEHSNVTWKEFLTTKFGRWIYRSSSTDNTLHGSSTAVEKSGILSHVECIQRSFANRNSSFMYRIFSSHLKQITSFWWFNRLLLFFVGLFFIYWMRKFIVICRKYTSTNREKNNYTIVIDISIIGSCGKVICKGGERRSRVICRRRGRRCRVIERRDRKLIIS